MVTDPWELLGKRMDFQIHIVRCLGTRWLKEDAERGIQMGYSLLLTAAGTSRPPVGSVAGDSFLKFIMTFSWGCLLNPKITISPFCLIEREPCVPLLQVG